MNLELLLRVLYRNVSRRRWLQSSYASGLDKDIEALNTLIDEIMTY